MPRKLIQSNLFHIESKLERLDKMIVSTINLCGIQQRQQEDVLRSVRAQLIAVKQQIQGQQLRDDIDRIPVDDLT